MDLHEHNVDMILSPARARAPPLVTPIATPAGAADVDVDDADDNTADEVEADVNDAAEDAIDADVVAGPLTGGRSKPRTKS